MLQVSKNKPVTYLFGTITGSCHTKNLRNNGPFHIPLNTYPQVFFFKNVFPRLSFRASSGWCPSIDFLQDLLGKMGHGTVLDSLLLHPEKPEDGERDTSTCHEYKTSTDCACLQWPLAMLLGASVISCARGLGMSSRGAVRMWAAIQQHTAGGKTQKPFFIAPQALFPTPCVS